MEWLTLPQMATYTASALNHTHFLSENLVVNVQQMRNNIRVSNGLILAEVLDLALASQLGRTHHRSKSSKVVCL